MCTLKTKDHLLNNRSNNITFIQAEEKRGEYGNQQKKNKNFVK